MAQVGNIILRQINRDDNTSKLSLGKAEYTPLKTFLKKDAFDFHQYEIAKTYVLVDEDSVRPIVWGYITLVNSEIILNEEVRPKETSQTLRYEAFPAIKIARLAIDKALQGSGYGVKLLNWCVSHIKMAIMPYVGCRFLVVDAKRDSVEFYQKSGFVLLASNGQSAEEHPMMFFDLYQESKA